MSDLFDKVRQEVEKGITAVNLKSRETVENVRIRLQIEDLQKQINTATTALGEAVYAMAAQQNFDQEQIRNQCAGITVLKNQLADKEKELEQIRIETGEALGKTYCSQCKTELTGNYRFCPQCGTKVE